MHISIKQHAFSIRAPYSEGTVLTKAEAQALNALRAENIRNNCFKLVVEALSARPTGDPLPAQAHRSLQERITEYDLKYQFPQRPASMVTNPIEVETLIVATERVEAQVRQAEQAVSRQEYELALEVALASPAVQAEARRRVALANEAARKSLEDLF